MLLPVLGFSLNLGCFDLPYFTEYLQLYSDLFGLFLGCFFPFLFSFTISWVQAMFPGVGGPLVYGSLTVRLCRDLLSLN